MTGLRTGKLLDHSREIMITLLGKVHRYVDLIVCPPSAVLVSYFDPNDIEVGGVAEASHVETDIVRDGPAKDFAKH